MGADINALKVIQNGEKAIVVMQYKIFSLISEWL